MSELELIKGRGGGDTHSVQGLDIFDTVEFVRLGRFAAIYLTNGLVAILLEVGPVGEIADDPSERVAKVDASSDY